VVNVKYVSTSSKQSPPHHPAVLLIHICMLTFLETWLHPWLVYCITLVQSLYISCYVSSDKLVLSYLLLCLLPHLLRFSTPCTIILQYTVLPLRYAPTILSSLSSYHPSIFLLFPLYSKAVLHTVVFTMSAITNTYCTSPSYSHRGKSRLQLKRLCLLPVCHKVT
jgi:hypothetical protein